MNHIIIDQQERFAELQTVDLDYERDCMQKMAKLLDNISNKKNYILDIDTLSDVFSINNLDELDKRELIIKLMEYNKSIYDGKLA